MTGREWRRAVLAAAIGVAGEASAIGLLATGAWLLLSASLRPPILGLSAAIAATQAFSLMRGTARYGERIASHDLGLRLQARLRVWLYRTLEPLLPGGLPGGRPGDLLASLIADTEETQDLIVRVAVPVSVTVFAWLAAALAAAVLVPAAGAVIAGAGLLGQTAVAVTALCAGRAAAGLPAARGAVSAWAGQVLASAEELLVLGAGDWALTRLAEHERALAARTRAAAAVTGLSRAFAALTAGAVLAGVIWLGAAALRAGQVSPAGLGVLVFLAVGAGSVLQGLPDSLSRLAVSLASLRRLTGIAELPAPVAALCPRAPRQQPALALPRPAPAGPRPGEPGPEYPARNPVIRLRGAVAARPGHDSGPAAPAGLDLDLLPGRPVALAGPSGSGKTSLILAMLRFTDFADGEITVDGTDIRNLPAGQVRDLMAWSPERPMLFPAPLGVNLRLGAPRATDEQITRLLAEFGLGPWLRRLEHGLDTVMAPWGHPVSGGELKRLSLARALLSDRPVLLLDEPTGQLDEATARAVLDVVLARAADRALLWVTHRGGELAMFPEVRRLPGTGI